MLYFILNLNIIIIYANYITLILSICMRFIKYQSLLYTTIFIIFQIYEVKVALVKSLVNLVLLFKTVDNISGVLVIFLPAVFACDAFT